MKKFVLLLLLTMFFVSCGNKEQSNSERYSQLKEESLQSGIVVDTILNGVHFGMVREELAQKGIIEDNGYYFDVTELSDIKFTSHPKFLNDSLYELQFYLHNNSHKYKDIISLFELKYGENKKLQTYKKEGENTYNCSYWFIGNLEIKTSHHDNGRYSSIFISYTDNRREILRAIFDKDDYDNLYTKEYYDSIVVPRKEIELREKKEALKGI